MTVTANSPSDDVTVPGPPMVFTTANWRTQQTVTVEVAADAGKDEEQSVTLAHTVQGGDYSGLEGPSVTVTIPVEGAPSAPRGLAAAASDESVTLTWRAPADDGGSAIVRYQVRYQESGGSYSEWVDCLRRCGCDQHQRSRVGERQVLRLPDPGDELRCCGRAGHGHRYVG